MPEEEEEEQQQQQQRLEQERRWTKLKISSLDFSNMMKVSGTFGEDLALE